MQTYSIYSARTGECLIASIEIPADRAESVSDDNEEGHFQAGQLDELTAAGLDSDLIVYALLKD